MKKRVFISHSSKDAEIAMKICTYLEDKSIECFIAPRDLLPGKIYGEEIVRGIDECEKMILVASKNSFSSQHVLREIERAVNSNMMILVYKIDDSEVPKSFEYFIMLCQWLDATASGRIPEIADIINNPEDYMINTKSQNLNIKNNKKLNKKVIAVISGMTALVIVLFMVFILATATDKNEKVVNIENKESTGNNDVNKNKSDIIMCNVGDTIPFGKYNGEDIQWTVLSIENDEAYLISNDIISIKVYDAAESGRWNVVNKGSEETSSESETYDRNKESEYTDEELKNAKGSNDWADSNIRIWLNSSDTKVKYIGTAPDDLALYDSRISYDREAGFMTAFTDEEKSRIVEHDGDYVFLPSVTEVNDYIINGNVMYPEAKPTKAALDADKTNEIAAVAEQYDGYFAWMTRTPDESSSYKVINVLGKDYTSDNDTFYSECAGYPRGVRPAIVIKLD